MRVYQGRGASRAQQEGVVTAEGKLDKATARVLAFCAAERVIEVAL